MYACIYGQLSTVKLLRYNGAVYEDYDLGGTTPLHFAIDSCNCDLIEWMISDGANVNIQDKNAGWTPLMRCGEFLICSFTLSFECFRDLFMCAKL